MSATPPLSATYYLDVLSSWCHWAEPTWVALHQRHRDKVAFDWRIALMDPSGIPASRDHCDAFYRRSGIIARATHRLSSAWLEDGVRDYSAPNLVAEAARDLGAGDDRARLALAHAALVEGRPMSRIPDAARVAAAATALDSDLLAAHARTEGVRRRVRETTDEFLQLGGTQRPTFVLENDVGDRAVLSGFHRPEPLFAAVEALLADSLAFASWQAQFGDMPATEPPRRR